jgi:hypothetical protein
MNCNLVTSALRQCVLPIVAVSALLLVAISAQAAAGVHFQTLVPSTFGDAATLRVALPLRNVGGHAARRRPGERAQPGTWCG